MEFQKEEKVRINYQIMTDDQKNKYGNYIPDYNKLIAGATCREEEEYIREVKSRGEDWEKKGYPEMCGFAWNLVYIARQACGHFEIFQSQLNQHYILERILDEARTHAESSKCTRCICGRTHMRKLDPCDQKGFD